MTLLLVTSVEEKLFRKKTNKQKPNQTPPQTNKWKQKQNQKNPSKNSYMLNYILWLHAEISVTLTRQKKLLLLHNGIYVNTQLASLAWIHILIPYPLWDRMKNCVNEKKMHTAFSHWNLSKHYLNLWSLFWHLRGQYCIPL